MKRKTKNQSVNVKPIVKKVINSASSIAKITGEKAVNYASKAKSNASRLIKDAEIRNKKQKLIKEEKKLKPIFNTSDLECCEMVCFY